MKGVRDCSGFRGGGVADGIHGLPFPKYSDPTAYPIFFYPVPLPSNSLYFWDDPIHLKFHLLFDTM